jgi:aminopeptidase N
VIRSVSGVLAVALLLAACGGDDTGDEPAPSTSTTATSTSPPPATGESAADTVGDPYTPDSGATGYDVAEYDLDLTWDPDAHELSGTAVLTATATTDLDAFSVDLLGLEVDEVTVDGEPADTERSGRDLTIDPATAVASGAEFVTDIDYGGEPQSIQTLGFETGWITLDDGTAFVIGEPDGAATWFPSNDHPSDKATFTIEMTVPEGWTVAANGELVERQHEGDSVTWTWEEDDPMATYLATVAIARFDIVRGTTEDGIEVVSFYPRGEADELADLFDDTDDMIAGFEPLFGPYPFDEYGAIVVPDDLGLALETQTRSLFGEDVADIEEFRAHELAHQWFGDSVTPDRWEDIWLNEGFASYAELLWWEASDPSYDIDAAVEARRSRIEDTGPILDPGRDRWFSEAVYTRGGVALHALRRTVGDDAFFTILRRWSREHRHGVATTEEFVALASEVAGEDLSDFFQHWLEDPEVPPLP